MSWLVYKAKVIGTYTFIYAQKVWGLLPILKHRAKQGGTTAALSVGHAYTTAQKNRKQIKSVSLKNW